MDKQPTEARQDELARIREKLSALFVIARTEGLLTRFADGLEDADEAFSLTVSSGGICPECEGEKITPETGRGSDGFIRCETCNGTGLVTKTLGEIIKEAI